MIVVDQNNAGQTVDLAVGQVMELRLAENPTTGYRWTFVTNGAPACLVVSERFDTSAGPPGQGGEHAWQLKGALVGECDVTMRYARGFQPDAPSRSFALHVRVTP